MTGKGGGSLFINGRGEGKGDGGRLAMGLEEKGGAPGLLIVGKK